MANGKIQKMVSLLAGFCSVRFAYHLSRQSFEQKNESKLIEKIHKAFFDARIFNLPNEKELVNNVIWRIKDCKRNSKNNLGHYQFSQKELEGLTPTQVVQKLIKDRGINWEDMPGPYKWGVFIKKAKYEKEGFNPKTGETLIANRTRVVMASINLHSFSEDSIKLLMEKFANNSSEAFYSQFNPLEL